MANKAAFTAVAENGGKVGPKADNTTLVFNTIITRVGKGYDNTSGVFTAPFAGVYFFTFSYHADNHHKSGLKLMKNDEVIVQAFDDQTGASGYDNAGNSAVLELQEGDKVSMCLPAGCGIWASGCSTSFSGFLIYSD